MAKNNFHRDSTVWFATSTEVQASEGEAAHAILFFQKCEQAALNLFL